LIIRPGESVLEPMSRRKRHKDAASLRADNNSYGIK
jgi:hypothetical protein